MGTNSNHTPGPWQVMNDYDGATVVIANVDGESFSDGTRTFSYDFVCDTLPDDHDGSRSREIAIANARLIAAAPDMLAALKGRLECEPHPYDRRHWEWDASVGNPAARFVLAAIDAIAKAEGR